MLNRDNHHGHETHRQAENECCAHDASHAETELNPSAGNLLTTLQVVGVDCAEEVSAIQRALKPLAGVHDVRVKIMSGKAIIAHDERVAPEALIRANRRHRTKSNTRR